MSSEEDCVPLDTCKICHPELLTQSDFKRDSDEGIEVLDHEKYAVDFKVEDSSDSDSTDSNTEKDENTHWRSRRSKSYKANKNTKPYIFEYYDKVMMPSGKSINMPVPARSTRQCGQRPRLYTLDRKSREFHIVKKEMVDSMVPILNCDNKNTCFDKYNIIKIQRNRLGCAWRKYKNRKRDVQLEAGAANETMMFHGTDAVWDIVRNGFDERYASSNGQFGAGLYFAKNSSVANQFVFGYFGGNGCTIHKDIGCKICKRHLLLCRVIMGKTKFMDYSENMAHPPPGYHSVEAVVTPGVFAYSEFIVYRGEQAYPEYLITYTIE